MHSELERAGILDKAQLVFFRLPGLLGTGYALMCSEQT
jgi:hypothetical protein